MIRTRYTLRILSLSGLTAVAAFSAACSHATSASSPSPAGPAQDQEPVEVSTPEAIALAREDSVRRPYTAADIEFMSGMIHHHRQAVTISRWAPTHGASERVRTLASRIILGQNTEIGIMKKWLSDRRQPVPAAGASAMPMNMPGMDHTQHAMLMPGMLTDAQMKELDAARGTEFDRLFLTYMIQHHMGAISMVEKLMMTPGAGQDEIVYKFSAEIQAGQRTEIGRMQQILETLPAGR